jgi:hypothetical protein
MHRRNLAPFVLVGLLASAAARADVVAISPTDDLRAAIAALEPGDELALAGGVYALDSRFNITVVGTAAEPIVIRAQDGADALIFMSTPDSNILEVEASRYLVLRNLRFRGGSHGIRLMQSSFITIEGCEVFETGDVAISANAGGTYEGLVIRRNHIHHTNGTGEGLYLGCNSDACRVRDSIIEWNYIHHTNGPTVDQGDGIEIKEGSSGNIVRHNVIHDTNYPGILTYGTVGNGPPNVIEGNLIWNTNDYGIQSAADSIIRNNIVLGGGIGLQAHQAASPSNQIVVHNTVIGDDTGIAVRNVSGPVVIANNAVYSRTATAIRVISGDTAQVTVAGNVGVGGLSGRPGGFTEGSLENDFIDAHFGGAPPIDVFPQAGGALVGAGDAGYVPELDFNGAARGGAANVGAYRFASGGNAGWVLAPQFKSPATAATPRAPTALQVN